MTFSWIEVEHRWLFWAFKACIILEISERSLFGTGSEIIFGWELKNFQGIVCLSIFPEVPIISIQVIFFQVTFQRNSSSRYFFLELIFWVATPRFKCFFEDLKIPRNTFHLLLQLLLLRTHFFFTVQQLRMKFSQSFFYTLYLVVQLFLFWWI